jgi:hypothetical protein
MEIRLDGAAVQTSLDAAATLQEVVDAVRNTLPRDQLVVSIAFDERTLDEQEIMASLLAPVPPETRVDLATGDKFGLTAAALREVGEKLLTAGDALPGIASQMRAGRVASAMNELGDCLHVWNQCQTAISQSGRLLGVSLMDRDVGGSPVRTHVDELVGKLREIRGAFDAGDMVLLADIFEYEMPGLCAGWQRMLCELADGIERPPVHPS